MYKVLIAMGTLVLALPVFAGFESGSNESDGALNCETLGLTDCATTCSFFNPCEVQILLGLAETGPWDADDPLHEEGVGVYDPVQWAVVYHYTTIEIPAFVTVTFANHHSGAPVMWLATGDVLIAGSVRVDGEDAPASEGSGFAVPGPGGFGGGIARLGRSAGFGPGGGSLATNSQGGGGGYGSAGLGVFGTGGGVAYGTDSIVPLIGGSGGSAIPGGGSQSGGAGGGALLIASSGNITLDSTGGVFANGGEGILEGFNDSGSGSGGGIRLVANAVLGSGVLLHALGGTVGNAGGDGRIRVDAAKASGVGGEPGISQGAAGPIFPEAPAPILRATAVNGIPVPVDPLATVFSGDVAFTTAGPVVINIEALNAPGAAGMIVNVRIVQADGGVSVVVQSTALADDNKDGILTATAEFDITSHPPGKWEVHLSVQLP